jgi:hypothetical protein
MKMVTIPSLAYIATIVSKFPQSPVHSVLTSSKVRLNLSSCENFNRQDELLNSEGFYRSVVRFLEDPNEREEVEELLKWWNL